MKLSAYGRTELARVEKTVLLTGQDREVRTQVVLLSDRTIGTRNSWLKPNGTIDYSTGWRQLGKLKKELFSDPQGVREWVERKERQGYTRV